MICLTHERNSTIWKVLKMTIFLFDFGYICNVLISKHEKIIKAFNLLRGPLLCLVLFVNLFQMKGKTDYNKVWLIFS